MTALETRGREARILSGNKTVISTGTIIAFNDREPIEISFGVRGSVFTLILEQAIDPKVSKTRWEFLSVEGEPEKIRLRLINLHSTPISASPQASRLWTGPEDSIFLQLRCVSLTGATPTFHYTLFSEPASASNA